MAYAIVTDVGSVVGFTFAATSKPVSSTQVGDFIDQVESEMRGALAKGNYEADPTDADVVNVLRTYCSTGAAAMVMGARNEPERAVVFQRRFDAWLTLARTGQASGLEAEGPAVLLPSSYYTRHKTDYPLPAFRRGETQW